MAEHESNADHGSHAHHVTPISKLAATFGFLLVMMMLTIAAARLPIDMPDTFGWLSPYFFVTNAIALGIAIAKAVAVVRIFMGAKYTTKLVKLYAVGGFVWFTLLFIMFFDYGTRKWEEVRGWEPVPSSGLPRNRESEAGLPYPVYEGSHGAEAEGGHGEAAGDGRSEAPAAAGH
ncbi:MAG: hypothetical protein AB7F50_10825 [Fimbriimonadaceae bacterium]